MKFLIFIFFTIISTVSWAQSFLKKDSMNMNPFISNKYYSTDLEKFYENRSSYLTHHNLSDKYSNNQLTLGNFGSELIPITYHQEFHHRPTVISPFIESYFYLPKSIPYYALNRPYSELDFLFFGNRNEEFNGNLSQNLSKKFNLGIGVRRSSNNGYFNSNQNLHNNFFINSVLQLNRWRNNIEFYYNDLAIQESGGTSVHVYDSLDPNRWSTVEPKMNSSTNKFVNYNIAIRNRFLLIKSSLDTTQLLHKPLTSPLSLDIDLTMNSQRRIYSDNQLKAHPNYYGVLNNDTSTFLFSKNLIYSYQVYGGLNIEPHKFFKSKIYSFISYDYLIQSGKFEPNESIKTNLSSGLGGYLQFNFTDNINFTADVYKNFTGYTSPNLQAKSAFNVKYKENNFSINALFQRQMPLYYLTYYYSNQLQKQLTDKPVQTLLGGASWTNQKQGLLVDFQFIKKTNDLIFDTSLNTTLKDYDFIQLRFKKNWRWGILYFPTEIYYQNSLFTKTYLAQTLSLSNRLFKNKLNYIIGIECFLNFDFYKYNYSPLLMQNLYQAEAPKTKIYPRTDLFLTMEIARANVSLVFQNISSTFLNTGTEYNNYYPITPFSFYFRVKWVFLD